MEYQVEFKDVGRSKACFAKCFNHEPEYMDLYLQVKKYLCSSGIDFSIDGGIFVGGFRRVGTYTVSCLEGPDEKIECCGNCEYWAEKYSICEHPDCPQGIADFVCADRDACELWESAT